MVKHIVLFNFKDGTSQADVDATLAALNALPGEIPWARDWSLGKNFSEREKTYTHALCCHFADRDELKGYLEHPAHVRVLREKIAPFWGQAAIMDYEF